MIRDVFEYLGEVVCAPYCIYKIITEADKEEMRMPTKTNEISNTNIQSYSELEDLFKSIKDRYQNLKIANINEDYISAILMMAHKKYKYVSYTITITNNNTTISATATMPNRNAVCYLDGSLKDKLSSLKENLWPSFDELSGFINGANVAMSDKKEYFYPFSNYPHFK